MPDRGALIPDEGETRFGTRSITPSGQIVFFVDAPLGKATIFAGNDTAGVTHYLWWDTTGDVRTDTAVPTLPNSDGTIVGTQS